MLNVSTTRAGTPKSANLLRKLWGFHFRPDDLQGDHPSGRLAVVEKGGAMADGEATLPELFSRLIFKPAWFPHQRWRRVGVDRHFAVVVGVLLGDWAEAV